jgi:protein-L-isoaspartate(D-aspartate) O-methyltransferase
MMWADTLPMDQPMMPMSEEKAQMLRLIMQLRTQGITDTAVLAAIEKTPREIFVESRFGARAYEDTALPINCGQTISQPSIVALMTQALEVNDRQRVLEIGTGSGYQAAILSKVCRMVYTIERHAELYELSGLRFESLKLRNIMRQCGDGYEGWPETAPFERIMLTAAPAEYPQKLLDQLSDQSGVMVFPYGREAQVQDLIKLTKTPEGVTQEILCKVRFVPMVADS